MTREPLRHSISFQLNSDSGVPAYLQLAQPVKQALRVGILDVGDKPPTVKEVVVEVAINPNTVMKAYRELEHEGLVEGRQGVGTFVTRRPAGPPPGTQVRLAQSLERWVQTARAEDLDDEAIESLLRSTLSGSHDTEETARTRTARRRSTRSGSEALRVDEGLAGLLDLGSARPGHRTGAAQRGRPECGPIDARQSP